MKLLWFVLGSSYIFAVAPLIPASHNGLFRCECTSSYCEKSQGKTVAIEIDASRQLISIENEGILFTDHPSKRHNIEKQVTSYRVGDSGVVHFDKDNNPFFGLISLWTCRKVKP